MFKVGVASSRKKFEILHKPKSTASKYSNGNELNSKDLKCECLVNEHEIFLIFKISVCMWYVVCVCAHARACFGFH